MGKNKELSLDEMIDILVKHGNMYAINSKEKDENGNPIGKYKSKIIKAKRDGVLSEEQLERLEVEGNMVWTGTTADINYMIRVVCRYGNISQMTPTQYTEKGERLGFYLRKIREYKRSGKLTEEQILQLEEAGIMWHGTQMKINDTVRKLVERGNLQEIGPNDTVSTGEPVRRLERYARRDYSSEIMTEEQKEALEQAEMKFARKKSLLTEREKILKRIEYVEHYLDWSKEHDKKLKGRSSLRTCELQKEFDKWQQRLADYDKEHSNESNREIDEEEEER